MHTHEIYAKDQSSKMLTLDKRHVRTPTLKETCPKRPNLNKKSLKTPHLWKKTVYQNAIHLICKHMRDIKFESEMEMYQM